VISRGVRNKEMQGRSRNKQPVKINTALSYPILSCLLNMSGRRKKKKQDLTDQARRCTKTSSVTQSPSYQAVRLEIASASSYLLCLYHPSRSAASILAQPQFLADLAPPSIDCRSLRRFGVSIIQNIPSRLQSLKKHARIKEPICV
jgi:hypothetical protein